MVQEAGDSMKPRFWYHWDWKRGRYVVNRKYGLWRREKRRAQKRARRRNAAR